MGLTWINVNCPSCGEQRLGPDQVHLTLYPQDPAKDYYDFTCTKHCNDRIIKPSTPEMSAQLRAVGVEPVTITRVLTDHPLLTEEDVEAFVAALTSTDRLSTIAKYTSP